MESGSSDISAQPLLEMRGIGKRFGSFQALSDIDFFARTGEIHALMGENGAGKSTLLKVLTGVYQPDAGSMSLQGKPLQASSPRDAQQKGVSMVYQELNLVPHLSVAENICLGRQPRKFGFLDWKAAKRIAENALGRLGLSVDVTRPVSAFPMAIQQMTTIARALEVTANLLILDEPTSSLDAAETERLFTVLRRLRGEGFAIVFVTHFLDQVYDICDRITVLRNGKLVGEYMTASLPRIELVARMLGKDSDQIASAGKEFAKAKENAERDESATKEAPVVALRGAERQGVVGPLQFSIRKGESVGLAGLLGSGRTETARMIFGSDPASNGGIEVNGQQVSIASPRQAIRHGFAFCSEDRKAQGIVPELSIRENMILAMQAKRGLWSKVSGRSQKDIADKFIKALNVATPDAEKPIGQLSGGNQQKVLLARWLCVNPELFILDEPTRGIDIGARAEIEKLVAELCEDGMAVLYISSELDEVLRCSHRLVVLRDRKQAGEISGENATEQAVMELMASGGGSNGHV